MPIAKKKMKVKAYISDRHKVNVLLFDDDLLNAFVMASVCESQKVGVIVAKTQVEALLTLTMHSEIYVIFIDFDSPLSHKDDDIKALKAIADNKLIKLVGFANSLSDQKIRATSLGVDVFLEKPISLEKLFNLLSEIKMLK